MQRWKSVLLTMFVALFGIAAFACVDEDDAPVTAQQTALPHTLWMPQVARDGPAGTFHYTVQAGDTLFSLAQRYGTTVARIQELNGLQGTTINVGQVLIMPLAPPTATPTRTPTATPTPPSGPSQLVVHGPRNTNYVALTFDMGGRVEPALDIMNFLLQNNVPSTIFMTGSIIDTANTDAGRKVLAMIEANPHMFELANHSYNHPDFRTLTAAQIRAELRTMEEAAARWSNLSARPFFRPPFGAYNQAVLNVVGPAGYPYTVYWDIDTIDWLPTQDGGPTAASMTTKVLNNAQGGSIVLMHLGGWHTLSALPAMVQGLRDRGYQPVKLSTMFGTN